MAGFCIREMTSTDLPEVARVDVVSFAWAAELAGLPPVRSERHLQGLGYYLSKAPELCLVADDPLRAGQILGYAIGHRWGTTVWVGPLGVDVPEMCRGIGSALLDEFRRRALGTGAATVGLETSIPSNVRFYARRGFAGGALRLLAVKELAGGGERGETPPPAAPAASDTSPVVRSWTSLSPATRRDLLEDARRLSGRVSPGLDHTVEFDAVGASGVGETLVALWPCGRFAGYAVIHMLGARLPVGGRPAAPDVEPAVWVLVGCPQAAEALLQACEERAVAAGGRRLRVPWYGAGADGYLLLRQRGYRPEAAYARMYLGAPPAQAISEGGPGCPAVLEFSAWLG